MTIARKPRAVKGTDVEALINKGGSTPKDTVDPRGTPKTRQKTFTVPLRFPDKNLLERIDKAVSEHSVKISRNTWLHYAITEKLDRDGY